MILGIGLYIIFSAVETKGSSLGRLAAAKIDRTLSWHFRRKVSGANLQQRGRVRAVMETPSPSEVDPFCQNFYGTA